MSVELVVLSDHRLISKEEWQRAINAEGLGIQLPLGDLIEDLEGFLPVRSNGAATGFECDHCDAGEVLALYPNVKFERPWLYGLVFRFTDFDACVAAYISAAVYAKASNGVLFDPQEGLVMASEEALGRIEQVRRDIAKWRKLVLSTATRVGGEL
jgi:hypothetical protein